jgi:uncharacterized repeat protein (TIGR02543 family)
MPDSDVTVAANWTIKTHQVTFNVDGGTPIPSPNPQIVNHGSAAIEPSPAPTKLGHEFLGWFLPEATEKFVFLGSSITGPISLTAKWELANLAITINNPGTNPSITVDGTVINAATATAQMGQNVTLNPGERAGQGFTGWTNISPAGAFLPTDVDFVMPSSPVSVTAEWGSEVPVVFHVGGPFPLPYQVVNAPVTIDVTIGTTISAPDPAPSRLGYHPVTWHATANPGPTTPAFNFSAPINTVTNIYARWVGITNNITVLTDGVAGEGVSWAQDGIDGVRTVNGQTGDTIGLHRGTRTGWVFNGWYVRSAPADFYYENQDVFFENRFTMPAGPVEITSLWLPSGEAYIEINFEGLEDLAEDVPLGPFAINAVDGILSIEVTLGAIQAESVRWLGTDGLAAPEGAFAVDADGKTTLTFGPEMHGNMRGDHHLTLIIDFDGVEYTKIVTVTVAY